MAEKKEEERDATEDLEEEELTGSIEDTDEEEDGVEGTDPGEALYGDLLEEGLVKTPWQDLTSSDRKKWNAVVGIFTD